MGEPFIIDNLHNGQQTLESFLASNFIETPPAGEVEDIATGLRESRLSHKEIGLIGMVGEDQSHPPTEATTNQDVGVQNQTLAFHLQGSIVLVSSLPLAPALEVGLESLLIQADPLQFRLHAAASLKQPLSLIHAAVVRERHIEANRAAMAGDLNWGGGFEMGGEPGPKLPNADTGCHAVQRELCTHFRDLRVRWVRNRGGERWPLSDPVPPPVTPRPSKPARTRNPGQDPPMPPTPSPTYERLRDYIAKRMRMSDVYQPLMLMELLGRRNPAPAQDVARRILGEDVTQIDYYTERVKRMVGKVLTGNGITRYDQGTTGLVGGEELSDAEREELLQLCRQRLDAF